MAFEEYPKLGNAEQRLDRIKRLRDDDIVTLRNLTKDLNDLSASSGLTAEQVEDQVAGLLTEGTNITLTYDDGAGTLTIDAADNQLWTDDGDGSISYSGDVDVDGTFTLAGNMEHTGNIVFTKITDAAAPTATVAGGAGNVTETNLIYYITFVTEYGETLASNGSTTIASITSGQVDLTSIPTSSDPRVTARRIYRKSATTLNSYICYLDEIADNTTTTYTDNIAPFPNITNNGQLSPDFNTTAGSLVNSSLITLGKLSALGDSEDEPGGIAIRSINSKIIDIYEKSGASNYYNWSFDRFSNDLRLLADHEGLNSDLLLRLQSASNSRTAIKFQGAGDRGMLEATSGYDWQATLTDSYGDPYFWVVTSSGNPNLHFGINTSSTFSEAFYVNGTSHFEDTITLAGNASLQGENNSSYLILENDDSGNRTDLYSGTNNLRLATAGSDIQFFIGTISSGDRIMTVGTDGLELKAGTFIAVSNYEANNYLKWRDGGVLKLAGEARGKIFFDHAAAGSNIDFVVASGADGTETDRFQIMNAGGATNGVGYSYLKDHLGVGVLDTAYWLHVDGEIAMNELSADPADPSEGASVMWMSDGTGAGDDGDIMMKITAGGVTKTATIVDFSAV